MNNYIETNYNTDKSFFKKYITGNWKDSNDLYKEYKTRPSLAISGMNAPPVRLVIYPDIVSIGFTINKLYIPDMAHSAGRFPELLLQVG